MQTLPETLMLPSRTLRGRGAVAGLLDECRAWGKRGLLVHGRSLADSGRLADITRRCPGGLQVETWQHAGGEPTLAQLDDLLRAAREQPAAWVAAVGGGSVMDLAKAAAGLLDAPLPPVAYHDGKAIPAGRIPFIAVPTTAGTGSEATIVSVLTNQATGVKKSIRHPSFMPRLVILDPGLLTGCPPAVVAASGMDAFTQAVESYFSNRGTWLTSRLALRGAALIGRSIEAAFGGDQGDAPWDLLEGSYLAGLALSNARLGLVHGLAHPLGARFHQPHGLVCAVCLPHVLEFNREALPGDALDELNRELGEDLQQRTGGLLNALGIASPFAGQPILDREAVIAETLASGSTAANPRPVQAEDVDKVLDNLFAPPGCYYSSSRT